MSVYRGQVASPHSLTLVTLGDVAVGKTSLINRFCSDNFNEVSAVSDLCDCQGEISSQLIFWSVTRPLLQRLQCKLSCLLELLS